MIACITLVIDMIHIIQDYTRSKSSSRKEAKQKGQLKNKQKTKYHALINCLTEHKDEVL